MKAKGFTLIEVLIAVVIVGILASIAIPSYQDSVRKSRRADAQAGLLGLAQAMERHFTSNATYTGAAVGGNNTGAPAIFSAQTPVDGNAKFYNLTIHASSSTAYTLRATPINGQVGDGIMSLDNLGRRVWDRDNDGDLAEASDLCWSISC